MKVENLYKNIDLITFKKKYSIENKSSETDTLIVVLDGMCRVEIGEQGHVLNKNDKLFIEKNTIHSLIVYDNLKMLSIKENND